MPTSLLRAGPLAADFVSGVNRPTFAVRNGHRVAVFPAIGDTRTFFTLNMPTVFAQGDIKVKLTWMAGTATSGDCVWEVAFERHEVGVDDLDSDSFATPITFVQTAPATAGVVQEAIITVSAAQYDGIIAGDQFRLRVSRLDDTSNTMVGDAQLMTVVIEQDADPVGGGGGGFWSDGAGTRAGIGQGSPAPTSAGIESLAHGTSASAAGAHSLALFDTASAPLSDGIAIGRNSLANQDSVSLGRLALSAALCVSLGQGSNALGVRSVAAGPGSIVKSTSAGGIAIGDGAKSDNPDHINIGRGFVSTAVINSNDLITIGRAHTNTVTAVDAIGIGRAHNLQGVRAIAIGTDLTVGARNIMIGHDIGNYTAGGVDPSVVTDNVVIKGQLDYWYGGIFNLNGGTVTKSISITAGGQRGGIVSTTLGNVSRGNIVMGCKSYMFENGYNNTILGYNAKIGQAYSTTDYNNQNFVSGYGAAVGYSGGYATKSNIVIGYYNKADSGSHGTVCIGLQSSVYPWAYGYTVGVVNLGAYNTSRGGMGNILMGFDCKQNSSNLVTSNTSGNITIGRSCISEPPNTNIPWHSTMATGVGARAFLTGHRAFSADSQLSSGGADSKPNQGGFVVTKVETTDATQTTLMTFPTVADKNYLIWAWAVARRTDVDGENEAFTLSAQLVIRNAAGVPVLIGAPVAWVSAKNQGAPGWQMDIAIVGNNIETRVTGGAAKTVEWESWTHVLEVRG